MSPDAVSSHRSRITAAVRAASSSCRPCWHLGVGRSFLRGRHLATPEMPAFLWHRALTETDPESLSGIQLARWIPGEGFLSVWRPIAGTPWRRDRRRPRPAGGGRRPRLGSHGCLHLPGDSAWMSTGGNLIPDKFWKAQVTISESQTASMEVHAEREDGILIARAALCQGRVDGTNAREFEDDRGGRSTPDHGPAGTLLHQLRAGAPICRPCGSGFSWMSTGGNIPDKLLEGSGHNIRESELWRYMPSGKMES